MSSLHNTDSTSCHLRLTNSTSTTTDDLSGSVIATVSANTMIRNYEAGNI
jgi:hypothetical protein